MQVFAILALLVFQDTLLLGENMTRWTSLFLVLSIMAVSVLAGTVKGAMASDSQKTSELTIYVPGNPEGGFDKSGQALRRALIASDLVEKVNIVR